MSDKICVQLTIHYTHSSNSMLMWCLFWFYFTHIKKYWHWRLPSLNYIYMWLSENEYGTFLETIFKAQHFNKFFWTKVSVNGIQKWMQILHVLQLCQRCVLLWYIFLETNSVSFCCSQTFQLILDKWREISHRYHRQSSTASAHLQVCWQCNIGISIHFHCKFTFELKDF